MKIIQSVGLVMFLAGFAIFIGSFFTAHYRITDEILGNSTTETENALIQEYGEDMLDHNFATSYTLISQLSGLFEQINQELLNTYSFTSDELQALANRAMEQGGMFSLANVEQVIGADSEAASFKLKSFQDYGSWLDQRQYENQQALFQDLQNVAENIRLYGIINQKGFDRYRIKDLKFQLAKAAGNGPVSRNPWLFLGLTYGLCIIGAMMYILPKRKLDGPPGIKNNNIFFSAMKNKGWLGILTGTFLIVFYVLLYYFPEYMTNWIIMVDPISQILKGSDAGRFFLYGFIYTLCILVMGIRMIIKYRHSKYQMIRTASVMFFQTAFAFLIPEILLRLNKPYFDFKNIWPLDYDFFFDNELQTLIDSGSLGIFMLVWGIVLILVAVPVLVYFFGKRWYCSWVCGCGGLAETLGDPYRQLSDKSLKAWKIERWMIHAVLVFAVVMTGGVLYTYFTGSGQVFGLSTYAVRETYGAWIGAGFAGVVGTGFYPLMGNRVWCRFGCPLAAYLGMVQRFKSRFRITTNGGQCISCGNCSTYCEMGIDVRWYAQRGQNIIRSSCVGCGICSAVCPRGVLNLENAPESGRLNEPILIGNDSFKIQA
ncbi:MAG: 4Fe-4S binding protein [Cyclobacteriaceae bacterium]|nr:4Fe-4S binding protein [Cyclobacteriaceae bacterium]